jgi:hypothetical protein
MRRKFFIIIDKYTIYSIYYIMLKLCFTCDTLKPIDQFNKDKSKKDGLQSKCKLCKANYHKEKYANDSNYRKACNKRSNKSAQKPQNKERYNKRIRNRFKENPQLRRNKNIKQRQWIYDFKKEHGCIQCGIKDPFVLDFDHINKKNYSISTMITNSFSIEKIKEEIKNCRLLCANCHRRRTAIQFEWHKDLIL